MKRIEKLKKKKKKTAKLRRMKRTEKLKKKKKKTAVMGCVSSGDRCCDKIG